MSSPLEILRSDWNRWNSTGRTKLWIGLGPVFLPCNGEGGDARLLSSSFMSLHLHRGISTPRCCHYITSHSCFNIIHSLKHKFLRLTPFSTSIVLNCHRENEFHNISAINTGIVKQKAITIRSRSFIYFNYIRGKIQLTTYNYVTQQLTSGLCADTMHATNHN